MGADLVRRHEALLAHARAGQAPEHRAIVDVQHHARAQRPGSGHRESAGLVGLGLGQVCARYQQASGRTDESTVEVFRADGHVGAVVSVEHQGEGFTVLDAEEYQGRQALGIGLDVAHVDAFGSQRFAHEAAVVFVAHAGEHGRLEAQTRQPDGGVGGRAAQVLAEASACPPAVRRSARHRDRPRRGPGRSGRAADGWIGCFMPWPCAQPWARVFRPGGGRCSSPAPAPGTAAPPGSETAWTNRRPARNTLWPRAPAGTAVHR